MRRQLNTLYITTEGAWLHKDGSNIVMDVDGQTKGRVPAHKLESVVCIGRVLVSPALLGFCAEQGICVCFLNRHGRFLARVEGPVSGNVLLRRRQYACTDDPLTCRAIVVHMLQGKLHGQRTVLSRALRDHGGSLSGNAKQALSDATDRLLRISQKLWHATSIDELRGLEGDAARLYFNVFDQLIRVDCPELRFQGRSRRPPKDPVNALLSFLYTLITHDCRGALETVGLDPAVGFLHRDRPGRPSLALDLLEGFRPMLADRLAISLINRRQLTTKDFRSLDNGGVVLQDDARKTVIAAYQERKQDEILHPFIGEKLQLGLLPYVQALLLARHLRGDIDGYPPFLWK